jgi:peptidoglycan/xylan/chitin deacetylase (PgdA/CDA1 family)
MYPHVFSNFSKKVFIPTINTGKIAIDISFMIRREWRLRMKYLFKIKLWKLLMGVGVILLGFLVTGLAVYRPEGVPVLMYHSVNDTLGDPLCVRPSEFEQQMRFLSENDFHSITLAQLEGYLYHKSQLPRRAVVITFDDGNKDNITVAQPILQKYHFTAAEFVPGSYIKHDGFSSEDIGVLESSGWDIGNHTFNHRMLPELSPEEQKQELESTNKILSGILRGKKIRYFSYPVGKYNDSVIKTLKDEGFTLAFTTEHGWATSDTDPMLIPRVPVGPGTNMLVFRLKVTNPNYQRVQEYFHKH